MIGFWSSKLNLSWLKSTAITLTGALLFTFIAPPFAEAGIWEERRKAVEEMQNKKDQMRDAFKPARRLPSAAAQALVLNPQLGEGFSIPAGLGTIAESWGGGQNLEAKAKDYPLVVHIQDAHGYYGAQKNAAGILKYLTGQAGGVLPVFVEGAWNKVDTRWMEALPDEKFKKNLAENLLRDAEITGEQYLAIAGGNARIRIEGVEDEKIYKANLKSRDMVAPERAAILDRMGSFSGRLKEIKKRAYPNKLLELDTAAGQFDSQKITLSEYFKYLKDSAHLDLAAYPSLKQFSEILPMEEKISIQAVEQERKNLLEALSDKLDKSLLAQLTQASLNFRMGKMPAAVFYDSLVKLARVNGVPTPGLDFYLEYLKRSEALDPQKTLQELRECERRAMSGEAGGRKDLEDLIKVSAQARSQLKYWDEKFAPDDWAEYSSEGSAAALKSGEQDVSNKIESFVAVKEKDLDLSASDIKSRASNSAKLSPPQLKFLQDAYYKLAFKRDRIMVENMLARSKEPGEGIEAGAAPQVVVLIAGGFHTPGVTRLLREKGAPYIVIRPNLNAPAPPESKPEPFGKEKYIAFVDQYLQNLRALRSGKDSEADKRIDQVIDIVENRLFYAEPVQRDGKTIVAGAYQGDESRVYFEMQYSNETQKVAQAEFTDALKASMGSVRALGNLSNQSVPSALVDELIVDLSPLAPMTPSSIGITTGVKQTINDIRGRLLESAAVISERLKSLAEASREKAAAKKEAGVSPVPQPAAIFGVDYFKIQENPPITFGDSIRGMLGEPFAAAPLWETTALYALLYGLPFLTEKFFGLTIPFDPANFSWFAPGFPHFLSLLFSLAHRDLWVDSTFDDLRSLNISQGELNARIILRRLNLLTQRFATGLAMTWLLTFTGLPLVIGAHSTWNILALNVPFLQGIIAPAASLHLSQHQSPSQNKGGKLKQKFEDQYAALENLYEDLLLAGEARHYQKNGFDFQYIVLSKPDYDELGQSLKEIMDSREGGLAHFSHGKYLILIDGERFPDEYVDLVAVHPGHVCHHAPGYGRFQANSQFESAIGRNSVFHRIIQQFVFQAVRPYCE